MKITITGGSGFLGSHVADELSKRVHKVKIFDKKQSKWLSSGQKMLVGNILNSKKLEAAIKGADVVFQFAALADIDQALKQPINSVNINILGTVKTLELCLKHKVKRFVYASTIYVNSSEGGFYRCSKKAAEDYIEEYNKIRGIDYTVLRYGSLYGERSDNTNGVTNIINKAINTGKITYDGSKNFIREYIHVLDAAKASADVIGNKFKNKHVILMGKTKIKVGNFLKILSKILKTSKEIKFLNKKYIGHYVISPYRYKPKRGKKFIFNSLIKFEEGLSQLVKNLKRKKKLKINENLV